MSSSHWFHEKGDGQNHTCAHDGRGTSVAIPYSMRGPVVASMQQVRLQTQTLLTRRQTLEAEVLRLRQVADDTGSHASRRGASSATENDMVFDRRLGKSPQFTGEDEEWPQ